jgi:hypothetical protein
MNNRPTTIERAFELARSGEYRNVEAVLKQLKAERLTTSQIEGPLLKGQLRALCLASGAELSETAR